MNRTLYLIRHGETRDAHPKRYKGSIDVPLSQKGIEQMKRLAQFMAEDRSHSLSAVYTSGLTRAKTSAEIISRPYGLQPVIVPELRERSFGEWEGMTFDEIRENYPAEFESWAGNPLHYSPVGGETTIAVKNRAIKALNWLLSRDMRKNTEQGRRRRAAPEAWAQSTDKDSLSSVSSHLFSDNIAVISHGGIIRIILCHVLGIPLENIFRIEQDFGALNVIEFSGDHPVIKLLNYTV